MIRNHRDDWITPIVKWRDDVTHRFPYLLISFTWDAENDKIREPVGEGNKQQILDIMERVTEYLINYSRDFIAFTISCKKPKDILLREVDNIERRYFSIVWASEGYEMDVSRLRWRFNDAKAITETDIEKAHCQNKRH